MEKNIIAEMTLAEYETLSKSTEIAIFPVGATEAYGHHLPLGSDWMVTYEVAKRVAKEASCFVAPPITYGFSEDLMCYPGTLSVSTMSIISMYRDVVQSLYRQGIKKILFLCGHVGNIGAIDQVACEAMKEYGLECAIIDWWRFVSGINKDITDSKFPAGHAAEVGTSVLMHLYPELVVKENMILNEKTNDEEEIPNLYVYEYFNKTTETSVLGNPFAASKEKGDAMIKNAMKIISEFITKWSV